MIFLMEMDFDNFCTIGNRNEYATKQVQTVSVQPNLKILGFPFNISATAEVSDFKFGMHLGFYQNP